MIQFVNVTKSYDSNIAIRAVNLNIEKGEMVFITGPSGAGKTTLLRLIYRAEHPDEGQIIVAGWDVGKLKDRSIPYLRRNIGLVFQDYRLLQEKTVYDNIALTLRILKVGEGDIKTRVSNILKLVGIRHKSDSLPKDLSGGEQQRAVIARALVGDPTVLLADEPTGNLDPDTAMGILKLFKDINTRGTTVLIATHNRDLFAETGKRVIYLRDGEIEREALG